MIMKRINHDATDSAIFKLVLTSCLGDGINSARPLLKDGFLGTDRSDLEEIIKTVNNGEVDQIQLEQELRVYDLMKSAELARDEQIINYKSAIESLAEEEKGAWIDYVIDHPIKKPAFIFVYGFNPKSHNNRFWRKRLNNGEYSGSCVGKDILDEKILDDIIRISKGDGVVLLEKSGNIYGFKVQLEFKPNKIPKKYRQKGVDYKYAAGFREKEVNMRQASSMAGSNYFRGTVIYTQSEETGTIRRFQNGRLTFSTNAEEKGIAKLKALEIANPSSTYQKISRVFFALRDLYDRATAYPS